MPRRARCVLPGAASHVTQRGVDRRITFSDDHDRNTYLRLMRENLIPADVRLLGWCLMTNHVHLVIVPGREDSLSLLISSPARKIRAILQRTLGTHRTLVAKPLFRLCAWHWASVGGVGPC